MMTTRDRTRPLNGWRLGLAPAAVLAAVVACAPARAQTAQDRPAPIRDAEAEKQARERELAAIRAEGERAGEARALIEREIATIRADRAALVAAAVDAAARTRSAEARVDQVETRLTRLDEDDRTIRTSLEARRGLLSEVLASLQRMGRRPPPALLVAPDDVLKSIRTAMLLGTVVPDMRDATRVLIADLERLSRLRREILAEREVLAREMATLQAERVRLDALAAARQQEEAASEQTLTQEKLRALGLARQADTLEQLIGRMETEIASAIRAADAARTSIVTRNAATGERRSQMAALAAAGRIAPALSFEQARGRLVLPVLGVRLREFGASDGIGGTERGLSLATRASAGVTAPADGWIVYSGPFRTYGQLLILNVGGGYHLVLAGLDKVSVELGQFVIAGEPVGEMGRTPPPAAAVGFGTTQPVLYVELRKDGVPIDPAPWWVRPTRTSTNERVRG